jgi:hypothetical protein
MMRKYVPQMLSSMQTHTHHTRTKFLLNSRAGDDAQVRATDAELDAGGVTSAKVLAY